MHDATAVLLNTLNTAKVLLACCARTSSGHPQTGPSRGRWCDQEGSLQSWTTGCRRAHVPAEQQHHDCDVPGKALYNYDHNIANHEGSLHEILSKKC